MSKTQKKRRAPRASGGKKTQQAAAKARNPTLARRPATYLEGHRLKEYTPSALRNGISGYLLIWRNQYGGDKMIGLFKSEKAAINAAETINLAAHLALEKRLGFLVATEQQRFTIVPFERGKPAMAISFIVNATPAPDQSDAKITKSRR